MQDYRLPINNLFKNIVLTGLLSIIVFASNAQLTEHDVRNEKWQLYGQVKTIGVAKASLEYKVNNTDTTFILLLEDERKELKNFFSVRFSSRGNTLHHLYALLVSFFEKTNWQNKSYTKIFTLGDTKVTVYKAAGLTPPKGIIFSTDQGRIRLGKNEIDKLFNK